MSNLRVSRAPSRFSFECHLGTLTSMILRKGAYAEDMAAEIANIMPAIVHGHVYYFYDTYHRICGYAAWALLTRDVEKRIAEERSLLLHESEWNEGSSFWIISFGARYSCTPQIGRALKEVVLPQYGEFRFMRPKGKERFASIRVVRR